LASDEEERKASQFTDLMLAAACGSMEKVKQHIDQVGKKAANE